MKDYLNDVDARAVHATFMKGDTVQTPFAWKDHPLSIEDPQVSHLHPTHSDRAITLPTVRCSRGFFIRFVLEGLAVHFNTTLTVCPELQVDNNCLPNTLSPFLSCSRNDPKFN